MESVCRSVSCRSRKTGRDGREERGGVASGEGGKRLEGEGQILKIGQVE